MGETRRSRIPLFEKTISVCPVNHLQDHFIYRTKRSILSYFWGVFTLFRHFFGSSHYLFYIHVSMLKPLPWQTADCSVSPHFMCIISTERVRVRVCVRGALTREPGFCAETWCR